MSNFDTIAAGQVYRARVTVFFNGDLNDPSNYPAITIYDPDRNVIVNSVSMTRSSEGIYDYTYTTNVNASGGVWEAVVSSVVASGKTLTSNDYWSVTASPPQVIINSIDDTVIPSVIANVRITNEGTVSYEYPYEWCVVDNLTNNCGGGDDIYYASAAKLIEPDEDFDTFLSATLTNVGDYYFKVVVYYGSEQSRSVRQFTAISDGGSSSGGGRSSSGGGGGTPSGPIISLPRLSDSKSFFADSNRDGIVNAVDFSILLSFWKTKPPFKNPNADINKDGKVDAVDFSIMLSQWGRKP
jgi:hypothetical protein